MSLLNTFWTYVTLVLIAILVLLALAIWDSSDSTLLNAPKAPIEVPSIVTDRTTNTPKVSTETVPSDFPAPAKKLHQLISDTEEQAGNTQSLDEKVKQLDKQLAEINQQLEAQGINVPQKQAQSVTSSNSDIEQRLNAIKDHIN